MTGRAAATRARHQPCRSTRRAGHLRQRPVTPYCSCHLCRTTSRAATRPRTDACGLQQQRAEPSRASDSDRSRGAPIAPSIPNRTALPPSIGWSPAADTGDRGRSCPIAATPALLSVLAETAAQRRKRQRRELGRAATAVLLVRGSGSLGRQWRRLRPESGFNRSSPRRSRRERPTSSSRAGGPSVASKRQASGPQSQRLRRARWGRRQRVAPDRPRRD
jgi:hypothetical protein